MNIRTCNRDFHHSNERQIEVPNSLTNQERVVGSIETWKQTEGHLPPIFVMNQYDDDDYDDYNDDVDVNTKLKESPARKSPLISFESSMSTGTAATTSTAASSRSIHSDASESRWTGTSGSDSDFSPCAPRKKHDNSAPRKQHGDSERKEMMIPSKNNVMNRRFSAGVVNDGRVDRDGDVYAVPSSCSFFDAEGVPDRVPTRRTSLSPPRITPHKLLQAEVESVHHRGGARSLRRVKGLRSRPSMRRFSQGADIPYDDGMHSAQHLTPRKLLHAEIESTKPRALSSKHASDKADCAIRQARHRPMAVSSTASRRDLPPKITPRKLLHAEIECLKPNERNKSEKKSEEPTGSPQRSPSPVRFTEHSRITSDTPPRMASRRP